MRSLKHPGAGMRRAARDYALALLAPLLAVLAILAARAATTPPPVASVTAAMAPQAS